MIKKIFSPLLIIFLATIIITVGIKLWRPTNQTVTEQNLLTDDEAKTLVTQLLTDDMATVTFFAGGFHTNPKATLPNESNYQRVEHSQLSSIQALYDYANSVYPPELAEQEFYLTEATTGTTPRFKEYNGFLYANTDIGGYGVSTDWHTDTIEIVNQTADSITVAMDLYRFDEYEGRHELTLQKTAAGNWVFTSRIDL